MSNKRTVEIFSFEKRDDGIIVVHAEADKIVDMRLFKLMVQTIGEISEGLPAPILFAAEELTIPDEEVRVYITKPNSNPYIKACALIGPSISQKLLANIYIKAVVSSLPVKLFHRKEEAIEWLKKFCEN